VIDDNSIPALWNANGNPNIPEPINDLKRFMLA